MTESKILIYQITCGKDVIVLYIAYLPKSKSESIEERKINNILKWYTFITENKYSVIAAPGYLSTSESGIEAYIKELSKILTSSCKKIKIGFLNGMNGHYKTPCGDDIVVKHNKELPHNNFEEIKLSLNKAYDHRKMLCFFTSEEKNYKEIKHEKINEFLDDIYVGAILIGSSNQSKTTYFNKIASKGEADIFMFDAPDNSRIKNFIDCCLINKQPFDIDKKWIELFDDIVITQSFYGKGHSDTQEFFKNILKDVLENGLKK